MSFYLWASLIVWIVVIANLILGRVTLGGYR
jgi:hypothetical protein